MSEILIFTSAFVTGLLVGAIVSFVVLSKWAGTIVAEALDDLRKEGFIKVNE